LGENISIKQYDIEEGVCKKWLVQFTYLNWCSGVNITRSIKIAYIDKTKPTVFCEPAMADANSSTNGCQGTIELKAIGNDDNICNSAGWMKWTAQVDINGDGTIDNTYSSLLPSSSAFYIKPTTPGEEVKLPGITLANSMANHKVFWTVTDGCGNTGTCTTTFMVTDKKAPTPYCVSISTAVMKNGQVEIWAKDFDKGSYDNCSTASQLLFTFKNESPVAQRISEVHFFKGNGQLATEVEYLRGDAQKWNPQSQSSGKIFDCDDVKASQPITLKMTVWDAKFNNDFCDVRLTIIDNQGGCGAVRLAIGGAVKTELGEGIKNSEMKLTSVLDPLVEMSNSDGNYIFSNLAPNLDYEIKGVKRDDWLNGVSTIDLVHIQRHILGVSKLNSPYKLIAADINNDSKVTASDLVALRRAILGVTTDFPNNNSWRYLDASTTIANVDAPWPLDEVINVNAGDSEMMKKDFMGIKVGDVNNSASGSSAKDIAESRSSKVVKLSIEDKDVKLGETIEIPVKAEDFDIVHGFQFTLNSDMKIEAITSGAIDMSANNFAKINDGHITMSWSNENPISIANKDEVLFTMKMKAMSSGKLSELLTLSSDITKAESYTATDMEVSKIEVNFNTAEAVNEYALYQNEPNPFRDETVIKYEVPMSGKVKFTVYDVSGKIMTVKNIDAVKGINTMRLTRNEDARIGLLYNGSRGVQSD
jgi:hypothetical protein